MNCQKRRKRNHERSNPQASQIQQGGFARRGEQIFEREIEPQLTGDEDPRAYVLIDIETGDYEISDDQIEAGDRLDKRHDNAQVWMRRVGSPFARRFGGRSLRWKASEESCPKAAVKRTRAIRCEQL